MAGEAVAKAPRHAGRSAGPARPRRGRWLALGLLAVVVLIPATTGWVLRNQDWLAARYHIRRLEEAVLSQQPEAALAALRALLELPDDMATTALMEAEAWPPASRDWVARELALSVEPSLTNGALAGMRQEAAVGEEERRRAALALRLAPENLDALRAAARVAYLGHSYARTVELLERLLVASAARGSDGGYEDYMMLGLAARHIDRPETAERAFRQAARMRMGFDEPLWQLLDSLERGRKYEEAVRVACDMLTTQPEEAELYARRGELFALLRQEERARLDFNAALRRVTAPGVDEEVLMHKADGMFHLGHDAEGLAIYEHLQRASRNDPNVLMRFADAMRRLGREPDAERLMREALLLYARHPTIYNNLAWLHATATDPEVFDPEEALALARQAFRLDGGRSAYLLDTLAEAYYVNGMYLEAERWERRAIEQGGEMYTPVLRRYEAAAAAVRRGETVNPTPSPLVDHWRPEPRDPTEPLRIDFDRTPPRMPPAAYARAAIRALRMRPRYGASGRVSMLGLMARQWQRMGASAVDDPRVDLLAILEAMGEGHILTLAYAGEEETPRMILQGLARGLLETPSGREGPIEIGRESSMLFPSMALARLAGIHLRRAPPERTGALLRAMARDEWRLLDFVPPTYAARMKQRDWTPLPLEQLRADWAKLRATLDALPAESAPPPSPASSAETNATSRQPLPADEGSEVAPDPVAPDLEALDPEAPDLEPSRPALDFEPGILPAP